MGFLQLDAMQGGGERVYVFIDVGEGERRTHGRLEPEPAQDRRRAMMTGAHR